MLRMLCVFEDVVMSAKRGEEKWKVELQDTVTGSAGTVQCTDTEFGCLMLLTAGAGEDADFGAGAAMAYAIVEPLFKDLPKEIRPFP